MWGTGYHKSNLPKSFFEPMDSSAPAPLMPILEVTHRFCDPSGVNAVLIGLEAWSEGARDGLS